MKTIFEKELKNKLALKSSGHTSEETVLLKAFKYFDLDNSGKCSKDEFLKAISKIGITGFSDNNLSELFTVYDVDNSGEIDYKEFVAMLYSNNSIANNNNRTNNNQNNYNQNNYNQNQNYNQNNYNQNYNQNNYNQNNYNQNYNQNNQNNENQNYQNQQSLLSDPATKSILSKIRSKLANRGVRGITSIARNFRIIDDNNDQTLDFNEFKKCSHDFRFDLSDSELKKVFSAFDRNQSGKIDYDEFIRSIRGEMNQFRKNLVQKAFNTLDKNKNGIIELDEIKEKYNAKNHPDVKNGKKTEDEVLLEFMETFENTYNYLCGTDNDGKVTIEEFMEYYENVSMSIDNDQYFEMMISNNWKNKDDDGNQKKGWSNQNEGNNNNEQSNLQDRYRGKYGDKPAGEERYKNYKQQQQQQQQQNQPQQYNQPQYNQNNQYNQQQQNQNINQNINQRPGVIPASQRAQLDRNLPTENIPIYFHLGEDTQRDPEIVLRFRNAIKNHANTKKGIIGLNRIFKIFDTNNDKTLDLQEFTKAMRQYNVPELTDTDIKECFKIFDKNNNGKIDYEEFIKTLRGRMNITRTSIVLKAFDKLDTDKSGIIEMNEIKSVYNAKNNADVKSGKKTEEEVYSDFLDTFQTHHNIKKGVRDKRVTRDEFVDYYNDVSMNVDEDEMFVEMVSNAWKLYNTANIKKAWSNLAEETEKANVNKKLSDYYHKFSEKIGGQKRGKILGEKNPKVGTSNNAPFGTDYVPTSNQNQNLRQRNNNNNVNNNNNNDNKILRDFREKIAKRGPRGIMSIRRAFMIADSDNSKTIDFNEFKNFCHNYRIEIPENDLYNLFEKFDKNKNNTIDYEEFNSTLAGEMNNNRKNLIRRIFNKFDKNGNGEIELEEIRNNFSAKNHPDVKMGIKTEDEVLAEFLDNFEYHFNLLNENKSKNGKINFEEFLDYYNNISMSIADDKYFEAIVNNSWK